MDEAARIDGCSWYGIFTYILVPMIVPALVTVGILTFINSWGDFMGSLLYLNSPAMYTSAYALKLFSDSAGTDFGATFAMSVLSLVPILIIFFFFQKQLVEGISTQGLKGIIAENSSIRQERCRVLPNSCDRTKEEKSMAMLDRLPARRWLAPDPYFSIWMPADTPTQTDSCHWSGPGKAPAGQPYRGRRGLPLPGRRP